jgi:CheY-like chemotaxis protein/anti-sigma regulatory factor (Ser/Thr protein kinase)
MLLKNTEKIDKTDIRIIPRQYIENENFLFVSDAYRISQVLQNLLENSLKYTFSGTIEIGYKLEKNDGEEIIDFYVKDTGVGIPQDQAEGLFDKYRTTGSNAKNASIATGFGLYISKNVASLLGGDLTFETSSNGTTFHLKVPYVQAGMQKDLSHQIATKAEKRKMHYPDKTVLIVEDEEANFKLLEVMLRKTNVMIKRAYNGKQAVDYIKGGNHTDLVLMDVRMPIMNGYEATEIIKQFDPSIPVIIQTAFAFSNDRERGFGSGCDEYLSKPIKASDLYLLLEKFFD